MLQQAFKNIDELPFQSRIEKHELAHIYEAKIKNMGNAGRNGGEEKCNVRSFENYKFNSIAAAL